MSRNKNIHVVVTVSPIRYRKYGYHGSQLSKATLLLAAEKLAKEVHIDYFPTYEIMNDELRDYRFYKEDMLHPTHQSVEYIWERFAKTYFSNDVFTMMSEWKPIKEALNHRPFDSESEEYKAFINKAREAKEAFIKKYKASPPAPLPRK